MVNEREGEGDRLRDGMLELAVNPIAFPCCTGPASEELFGRMPVSEAKLDSRRLRLDCDASSLSPSPLTVEFLLRRLVFEPFG